MKKIEIKIKDSYINRFVFYNHFCIQYICDFC